MDDDSLLIIHRGDGYYLVETAGGKATWHREPANAKRFTFRQAERLVPHLNWTFRINCEALDPILAAVTRTQRWVPTETAPQVTLTLIPRRKP